MAAQPRRGRLLDALRNNPEWRKLYLARAVSLLGHWLNTLAILHLLGEGEATEALALAVVFVLKQAPMAVLGPVAGVVADRFERRKVMIGCDLLSAALVLGFLATSPGGSRTPIYLLTFAQIGVGAFFDPAYRAVMPDLLRSEDLLAANALSAMTWSAIFAIGTALGGLVLFALGWQAAFALDALTYVISAAIIASIDAPALPGHDRPEGRPRGGCFGLGDLGFGALLEGIRYILTTREIRRIIVAKFVWGMMGAITLFLTLLGLSADHRLAGSGDLGISFLWFCRALGTGLGPVLARHYAGSDPRRLRQSVAIGFWLGMGFYVLTALTSSWWLAGLFVVGAHIGGSMVWVMSTVLLQRMVPTRLRGRTFAAELALVMLSSSLSHLLYGALLDFTSVEVRGGILLCVAVCAPIALYWTVRIGFARDRAPTQDAAAGG